MADLQVRLTKKAVVLAKKEVTFGVDPTPSASTDAIEISEPAFTIDPQILERNNVADDLSPFANIIGRKQATMTFTAEMKGNGIQGSGNVADAPVLAKLLEGCGYVLTGHAAGRTGTPVADFDNPAASPKPTWAVGGTITLTKPVKYTIEVTTGGISGTAEVFVTSNDLVEDDTSGDVDQVVTSGSPFDLGNSGATATPTWTGSLTVGQIWHVVVYPAGIRAKPTSSNQSSITLYMYLDGVLHKMTGSRGNFTITAEAGNYARVEFTFQGIFNDAIDAVAPTPTYDTTLPEQIEFSNLTWGSQRDLVSQQWTFEQGNTLTPRPDVNSSEGIKGTRITARDPQGGMNPEATIEADHPFWDEISRGKTQFFFVKVGQTIEQTIAVQIPRAQLTAMPYGDRDGLRTYDISFRCTRVTGDDEVEFHFV